MRPSPNLGPEFHGGGGFDPDSIPHVDASVTRGSARRSETTADDTPDFVDRVINTPNLYFARAGNPEDVDVAIGALARETTAAELRALGSVPLPGLTDTRARADESAGATPLDEPEISSARLHTLGKAGLPSISVKKSWPEEPDPTNEIIIDFHPTEGTGYSGAATIRAEQDTEPPHDSNSTPEQSHGSDPRPPEDEAPAEEPTAGAGGGPNEPPTDPSVSFGSTDPGEPTEPDATPPPPEAAPKAEYTNPVDRYRTELTTLAEDAQKVIAQAEEFYGTVHTVGTVVDGRFNTEVVHSTTGEEEDLEADAQSAYNVTREAIEAARQLAWGPDGPDGVMPTDYHIDDSVTYDGDGGYVGVQTLSTLVDGQAGEEVLTVTTITRPTTERETGTGTGTEMLDLLHARVITKGRDEAPEVIDGRITAIPAADVSHYDTCVEMFGDQTAITQVMQGDFDTVGHALTKLIPLAENARQMGIYPEETITAMLRTALRMGLEAKVDRATNLGLTPERLARLQAGIGWLFN